METIRIERKGDICHVILDRPDKRNAMNSVMWEELGTAADELNAMEGVRCGILRGEGKSFCAGIDLSLENNELLSLMQEQNKATLTRGMWDLIRRYRSSYEKMSNIPFPLIGALHGHVLGSGFELSLVADFRIAARGTLFAIPEVKLGMQPDMGGCARLAKLIGQPQARRLVYTGEQIDTDEAERIGLVQIVVEPDELMDKAEAMAAQIAANAPLAVQSAKKVFLRSMDMPLSAALEYESVTASTVIIAEDPFEAFAAKLERRDPVFKGK
ncbi:MAG: enoyl-CoA hydratase/isomerase family protein [Candidatus Alcyoniella australis]|nr:enoyl-CoA hydratase/isomerase family protein [Candidatus Alcyoniella australis]